MRSVRLRRRSLPLQGYDYGALCRDLARLLSSKEDAKREMTVIVYFCETPARRVWCIPPWNCAATMSSALGRFGVAPEAETHEGINAMGGSGRLIRNIDRTSRARKPLQKLANPPTHRSTLSNAIAKFLNMPGEDASSVCLLCLRPLTANYDCAAQLPTGACTSTTTSRRTEAPRASPGR